MSVVFLLMGCETAIEKQTAATVVKSEVHYEQMIASMGDEVRYPRTFTNGKLQWINKEDSWVIGFFPGSLWYLYELTGDEKWAVEAERFTLPLEYLKGFYGHHDTGFMVYCPFGNGYRFWGKKEWVPIIEQTTKSLCKRFYPEVGVMRSWGPIPKKPIAEMNENQKRCVTIIDNMMNLEMLFEASLLTGDNSYRDMAVMHANTTMKNHFRDDYSSYHALDYDLATGRVTKKRTVQGLADESAWSRGQAWGLYGYAMCYRYTQDEAYLNQAKGIANFIMNHPVMPADYVPYWDYDLESLEGEPRDASAAAITASALYELAQLTKDNSYAQYADKMVASLQTDAYFAAEGEKGGFLLKHSTGHRLANSEVDVPLVYADYYFLESLYRQKQYNAGKPVVKWGK